MVEFAKPRKSTVEPRSARNAPVSPECAKTSTSRPKMTRALRRSRGGLRRAPLSRPLGWARAMVFKGCRVLGSTTPRERLETHDNRPNSPHVFRTRAENGRREEINSIDNFKSIP